MKYVPFSCTMFPECESTTFPSVSTRGSLLLIVTRAVDTKRGVQTNANSHIIFRISNPDVPVGFSAN